MVVPNVSEIISERSCYQCAAYRGSTQLLEVERRRPRALVICEVLFAFGITLFSVRIRRRRRRRRPADRAVAHKNEMSRKEWAN